MRLSPADWIVLVAFFAVNVAVAVYHRRGGRSLDQFFACIVERCVGPCVAGTNAECTECSRNKPTPEESCSQAFFDCSGAELNPDYIVPE